MAPATGRSYRFSARRQVPAYRRQAASSFRSGQRLGMTVRWERGLVSIMRAWVYKVNSRGQGGVRDWHFDQYFRYRGRQRFQMGGAERIRSPNIRVGLSDTICHQRNRFSGLASIRRGHRCTCFLCPLDSSGKARAKQPASRSRPDPALNRRIFTSRPWIGSPLRPSKALKTLLLPSCFVPALPDGMALHD